MFETILAFPGASSASVLAALAAAAPVTGAAALATAVAALCASALTAWRARRRGVRLEAALAEAGTRLAAAELLLAATTAELSQARTRLDQLGARQEAATTAGVRSGFRQAIALSRHGATTRQLIDTCGLSQGEAHLIQTLYGRSPGAEAEELH